MDCGCSPFGRRRKVHRSRNPARLALPASRRLLKYDRNSKRPQERRRHDDGEAATAGQFRRRPAPSPMDQPPVSRQRTRSLRRDVDGLSACAPEGFDPVGDHGAGAGSWRIQGPLVDPLDDIGGTVVGSGRRPSPSMIKSSGPAKNRRSSSGLGATGGDARSRRPVSGWREPVGVDLFLNGPSLGLEPWCTWG